MFAARGVALGLGGGGVNLNDLRNLTQQSRTNGSNPTVRKNISNSVPPTASDVVDDGSQRRFVPARSTSISMGSVAKKRKKQKKTRIVVKKSLDRSTFYSVCRATLFGILLIGLGAAMSTLGYYKDHFATESVHNGNSSENFINSSTRRQYESLSYVGPCIMGVGAFVLMIACVMTMEGREQNTDEFRPRTDTNNSRVALAFEDSLREPTVHDGKPKYSDADPDANNNRDISVVSPADHAGKTNKCYTRDDSKSVSTATTTLTWSKNTGLKCEPANQTDEKIGTKYPSASCIDVLVNKTQDARALLQRFLDDESRLVERRIDRYRRKKQFASSYLTNQSASLDISDSEKISFIKREAKSDEIPSKCNIVAEVHHCGLDCDSPDAVLGFTSITLDSPFSGSSQWPDNSVALAGHVQCYSPMSLVSYEQSPNMAVINENFSNDCLSTAADRQSHGLLPHNSEQFSTKNCTGGQMDSDGNDAQEVNNGNQMKFMNNGQLYDQYQNIV